MNGIMLRNLALTVLAGLLAAYFGRLGQTDLAKGCIAFVVGLWLHSGRRRPLPAVPPLPEETSETSDDQDIERRLREAKLKAGVGMLLLLPLVGCHDNHLLTFEQRPGILAGTNADYVRMTPRTLPADCASGFGCMYTNSSDNLPHFVNTAGVERKAGEAWLLRQSAGTPGGSTAGDLWYETGAGVFSYKDGSGVQTISPTGSVVTLAGTQTITGDKTFTGALVLPVSASPAQTAEGSIVWNSSDLLTVGTGAGRKTMLDTNSTQTASGKTWTAMVVDGGLTASGSAGNDFSSSTGTFKTSTGAGTLGGTTTLAANKNLLCAAGTGAFDFSACSGAFTTPSGTNTLSGNLSIPTGKTATLGAAILWGAVTDRLNAAILAIASQAAGDLLYADSVNTMARLGIGTAKQALLVNAGATAPEWVTIPVAKVTGGAATAIAGGATGYLVAPGIAASSATPIRLALFTRASTVRNLYCVADTLPGGTDTITCAVKRQVGGSGALSATTVTTPACTDAIITAGTCVDTTHSQANVAGTSLVIECVQSATSVAAGVTCSFEVTL